MKESDQQAFAARQVFAGVWHGVLSTHSLEHTGYPFGSVVPYVLSQAGVPLMLLSHLSQHTKNLENDSRCGLTVVEPGENDVQQRGRLGLIGDVSPINPSPDTERYFDYFPSARMYFEQLGFRFHRLTPRRFHWNGGFATARWFGVERIVRARPLSRDVEARIVAHMNEDHRDALRGYLDRVPVDRSDGTVAMVGIDAEGIDLRMADRLYRVPLPRSIGSADDAHEVLIEMSRSGI